MAYKTRKGYSKFVFCPSLANPATPTQSELTAGTVLSTQALADVNGFDSKTSFIDVPNFASRQTPKIPGEKTSADSSMTFYEDDTSNPIATVLVDDTNGFIVAAPFGVTTATSKVDVFPVTVASNTRQYTSGNEAAKYVVDFAITAVPTKNAVMGS